MSATFRWTCPMSVRASTVSVTAQPYGVRRRRGRAGRPRRSVAQSHGAPASYVHLNPRQDSAAESVGQRLRRLRLERGLSQRELAGPGVSYAYISRIEAGARRPSVKALRMLAPKLGVSVEYLETGSDLRDDEERELRFADAELQLRLNDDSAAAERTLAQVLEECVHAGDAVA